MEHRAPDRALRAASLAGACVLLAGASAVMIGWISHTRELVQVFPEHAAMQFNTALCFAFTALAILLVEARRGGPVLLLPVAVGCLSAGSLSQYLFSVDLGIDQLFVDHFIRAKTVQPGRMAPNTAIAFLVASAASSGLFRESPGRVQLLACSMCACITLVFGAAALLGYTSGAETSYGTGNVTQMAAGSALCFVVLGATQYAALAAMRHRLYGRDDAKNIILAGFAIALGTIYMWQSLTARETENIRRATQEAAFSVQLRVDSRLGEVTRALRRMAQRLGYGMAEHRWRRDARAYLHDFPGYRSLLILGRSGTLATAEEVGPVFPEVRASALAGARGPNSKAGADGSSISDMSWFGDDAFFTVTLPIPGILPDRAHLVALIEARPFFDYVIGPGFVAPEFTLRGIDDGREFVRRGEATEGGLAHWARSAAETERSFPWSFEATPMLETIRHYRSPLSHVFLASGVALGILVSISLLLAAASRRGKQLAEAATEAKSNFLANMSHEIRSPLTAILGYTESMLHESLTKAERENALRTMLGNEQHLLQVINDILDLSKIEADRMTFELAPHGLFELLADTETMMKMRASEKGLLFSVESRFPLPRAVRTDDTRLKQILINLVGNAIKFTDTGSVTLAVSYELERRELVIAVADTGVGISEQQISNLFKPFSQADASVARRFGGTGLGLSISRRLAERLGGSVTVASAPGRGSVFTLRLPVGCEPELVHEAPVLARAAAGGHAASLRLSGKMLLADDSRQNREFVKFLLRHFAVEIVEAENGADAVRRAERERFDLILMDLQMPVMDGLTAIRHLRRRSIGTPIVAFTANAMKEDIERCREAGSDAHLSKPFVRREFLEMMGRFLASGARLERTPEGPMEDDAEYRGIVAGFLDGLPQRLEALTRALSSEDWPAAGAAAHKLASAARASYERLCGEVERINRTQTES